MRNHQAKAARGSNTGGVGAVSAAIWGYPPMSPLHIQMATSGVSDASQLTAMRLPELHPSTIWSTDPAGKKTFVLAPSPRALGTSAPISIPDSYLNSGCAHQYASCVDLPTFRY